LNKHSKSHGTGYLTLASGEVFQGELYGAPLLASGEVVFHTGMTGYQEVMSDPSFAGQIVTFTYPLIGNYGTNECDYEALKPALSGIIVSELCEAPSHFRSSHTLAEVAEQFGIPVLSGIDTRTITKRVRSHGDVYGVLSDKPLSAEEVAQFRSKQAGSSLVERVSTTQPIAYPGTKEHVVIVDLGMKKSILDAILAQGCRVTVVPFNSTCEDIVSLEPDALVFSNGPGDPADLLSYCEEWRKAAEKFPTLGICLGHQVISLMYGAKTERLPYGHRGSNHPVKNLQSGKVYMTSQNHGYVVKDDSIDNRQLAVTYRNVNDGSIEGVQHLYLPIQSVQFHPEAHPGPDDTGYIIEQFIKSLQMIGAKQHA